MLFFLEVKIAVFIYLTSPLFIWDAAKVSCISIIGLIALDFFVFLFVLMNILFRYRIASTGRRGVWCIRWCTSYGVLHGSHLLTTDLRDVTSFCLKPRVSILLPIKYRPLLWIIVLAHVVQGKLCTGEVIYIQSAIKNIQ